MTNFEICITKYTKKLDKLIYLIYNTVITKNKRVKDEQKI